MQVLRLDGAVLILVVVNLISREYGVLGYEEGFRLDEHQEREQSVNINLHDIAHNFDIEIATKSATT